MSSYMQRAFSFGLDARFMSFHLPSLMSLRHPSWDRSLLSRFWRYATVSLVSTAISLSLLGVFVGLIGFSATWSNVVATAVGTIPSFELNRRWVWSQAGTRSLMRQVLPFCSLSFAGLVLSTLTVHAVAGATSSATRPIHTLAVELANLGSYGILWLLQFLLCDHFLFSRKDRSPLGTGTSESAVRVLER